jgi:hypothetical protein
MSFNSYWITFPGHRTLQHLSVFYGFFLFFIFLIEILAAIQILFPSNLSPHSPLSLLVLRFSFQNLTIVFANFS